MRALAISDQRPDIDIVQLLRSEPVDLIITLGNLRLEDIAALAEIQHIPKIGVYGNHDSSGYLSALGIWDMHMRVWDFNGKRFGGFEGCVRYKQNPQAIMYTQEEASAMLQHMPPVDIFITHCPPRGINDKDDIAQQGFDGLRAYIDTSQPQILLHGHTQPDKPTIQHDATRIEHVHKYRIIDL